MLIPRVALLIETSNAYGRGLLAGIANYLQRHGPWSTYLPEAGRSDTIGSRLRGWKGDGIIIRAEDPAHARAALACKCPAVDLSLAGHLPGSPAVHSDVKEEARLAFAHLWERGFRNLGFCGVSDYAWVDLQYESFRERAEAAGVKLFKHVRPLGLKRPNGWAADRRMLVNWLKGLPKPVGIFACYDLRGQQILDACRTADLSVPGDVAVIGVDNDPVRCELSDPPLSSVEPQTGKMGYLAAELLDKMMKGKQVPPELHLVPPVGIIARRSTDAMAIGDPDVAAALRFIRANCCSPIGIEEVLQHVPFSRRSLESRFTRHVGRTPYAEILRCRVERAKQLLADTNLPIKSIAAQTGARNAEYLSVLFRRMVSLTPSEYRAKHQRAMTNLR